MSLIPSIGGFVFNTVQRYFYLVAFITAIMTYFAKNITRTRMGRAFIAIRDNDLAAEVMGINIFLYKVIAFGISGFYAGISGALLAHFMGMAHTQYFRLLCAVWYLGMLVVGGMGSTMGVFFGAFFFRAIDEIMLLAGPGMHKIFPFLPPEAASGMAVILWALLVIIFLFEPRGINHRWEIFKASYRLHPYSY